MSVLALHGVLVGPYAPTFRVFRQEDDDWTCIYEFPREDEDHILDVLVDLKDAKRIALQMSGRPYKEYLLGMELESTEGRVEAIIPRPTVDIFLVHELIGKIRSGENPEPGAGSSLLTEDYLVSLLQDPNVNLKAYFEGDVSAPEE